MPLMVRLRLGTSSISARNLASRRLGVPVDSGVIGARIKAPEAVTSTRWPGCTTECRGCDRVASILHAWMKAKPETVAMSSRQEEGRRRAQPEKINDSVRHPDRHAEAPAVSIAMIPA